MELAGALGIPEEAAKELIAKYCAGYINGRVFAWYPGRHALYRQEMARGGVGPRVVVDYMEGFRRGLNKPLVLESGTDLLPIWDSLEEEALADVRPMSEDIKDRAGSAKPWLN